MMYAACVNVCSQLTLSSYARHTLHRGRSWRRDEGIASSQTAVQQWVCRDSRQRWSGGTSRNTSPAPTRLVGKPCHLLVSAVERRIHWHVPSVCYPTSCLDWALLHDLKSVQTRHFCPFLPVPELATAAMCSSLINEWLRHNCCAALQGGGVSDILILASSSRLHVLWQQISSVAKEEAKVKTASEYLHHSK